LNTIFELQQSKLFQFDETIDYLVWPKQIIYFNIDYDNAFRTIQLNLLY